MDRRLCADLARRRLARPDRGVPRPPAGHAPRRRRHAARGRHAAGARRAPVALVGARGLAQGRGREPHRLLQGPRHDDGHHQGRRGRLEGRHLRLHRQHLGVAPPPTPPRAGSPARCSCPTARSRWASWPRRWSTAPGCCRSGQLRRLPRPVPRPVRATTRRRWSTRVNPYRIEGQKTAAFEICDVLGDAPDLHCMPVGNAGNITAYWKGYREYAADGVTTPARACWASRPPAPRRSSTARGWRRRRPSPRPSGSATPPRGSRRSPPATSRAARSQAVTDRQILSAYRLLARKEGVFVEPASAASRRRAAAGARSRAGRRRARRSSAPSPATA